MLHGKVQGVFCRAFVHHLANEMGLQGYVRNVSDGTVEVVVEASEEKLKEFEQQLKKPDRSITSAKIEKIDFEFEKPTKLFQGFRVLYF